MAFVSNKTIIIIIIHSDPSLMYLPIKSGGRGLKSVESEYKLIKDQGSG